MAFLKKWMKKNDPRTQYWGGSKEAAAEARKVNAARVGAADQNAADARVAVGAASATSAAQFTDQNNRIDSFGTKQASLGDQYGSGVSAALGNYGQGRPAVLKNAAALEANAANAERNYRTTSAAQFQNQSDQNQRAALALGARGGASGLRTALATSSNANATASNQAAITQAQEFNQIQAAKEAALTNAAGIRAGIAGQDSNVASLQATRQQSAYGNQLNANAQTSQNIGTQGSLANTAAGNLLGAATDERGQAIGAQTDLETSQLNAGRESEQQRLNRQDKKWRRGQDPAGVLGG